MASTVVATASVVPFLDNNLYLFTLNADRTVHYCQNPNTDNTPTWVNLPVLPGSGTLVGLTAVYSPQLNHVVLYAVNTIGVGYMLVNPFRTSATWVLMPTATI